MSIAPTVTVTLDKERTLKFGYGAYIKLEEVTGKPIGELLDARNLTSATGVRDFIWAGLLHEDPDLTRDQVADMLSFDRLVELQAAITQAIQNSMPKSKGTQKQTHPRKASRRR